MTPAVSAEALLAQWRERLACLGDALRTADTDALAGLVQELAALHAQLARLRFEGLPTGAGRQLGGLDGVLRAQQAMLDRRQATTRHALAALGLEAVWPACTYGDDGGLRPAAPSLGARTAA